MNGCTVHRYFLPSYSSICDRTAPQVDEAHDLLCETEKPPSYLDIALGDSLVKVTRRWFLSPSVNLAPSLSLSLPSCVDHGGGSSDKEL